MVYLNINPLESDKSGEITELILDSPDDYLKYFHPFEFNSHKISRIIKSCVKDRFFGIEIVKKIDSPSKLVGFYMLRGLDENFCDPMYGVFVSHLYSGKGIATLTIYHALTMCRILEYKKLLLKVYPDNKKAINLYNYLGFQYLKDDKKSGQAILFKIV